MRNVNSPVYITGIFIINDKNFLVRLKKKIKYIKYNDAYM